MPYLRTAIGLPQERPPDSPARTPGGMLIEARTLGEAIARACTYFGVAILPHDPPKWFRVYQTPDLSSDHYKLVDIHIYRGEENICPKQDLDYPLQEADIVSIGALAC